jgi:formylglycine-generating enzyme required for sulfatase activity
MANQIRFRLYLTMLIALSLCPVLSAQNPTGRELSKTVNTKIINPKTPPRKVSEKAPRPKAAPRKREESNPTKPILTVIAPPGALIEIDGRARGFVGVDGNLLLSNVAPGEHKINFLAEGYEMWQGTFVMGMSPAKFEVPARKKPGAARLSLTASEPEVEIFIDDKPGGRSVAGEAIIVDGLMPGTHQLRASKEGFEELTLTLTVTPDETQPVNLVLKPLLDPTVLRVPEGMFIRGKDRGSREQRPAQRVFISEFEISTTEVTNRQYKYFIDATGNPAPRGEGSVWNGNQYAPGKDDQPVVFVTWADAIAYCKWLSEQTGMRYRLPTEAEWEKSAVIVGDQYSSFGNIWEWCQDWYDPLAYRSRERANPKGPARGRLVKAPDREGEARVIRGGSFGREATVIRAAERNHFFPELSRSDIGFRVVREITQ